MWSIVQFCISRCAFKAYCLFSFLNTIVYCVPAGWVWGDHGFLNRMGVVDIAGSGPVHLVGGISGSQRYTSVINHCQIINDKLINFTRQIPLIRLFVYTTALACAIMLGPRIGRYDNGIDPLPLGSPVNAIMGLFVLW